MRASSDNLNKYDKIIIMIISLLSFGNYWGALQPIRVVAFLLMPYIILNLLKYKLSITEKYIIAVFLVWFIYIGISLTWTLNLSEGVKELFYYPIHFTLFFLIIQFAKKSNNPVRAISLGWIFVLMITLPIALYEVITFNHLSISRYDSSKLMNLGGVILNHRFASTTFINSNTYVVIINLCIPFLLFGILNVKEKVTKIYFYFILLIAITILFVNASRGGILTLFIFLIYFIYYNSKRQPFTTILKKMALVVPVVITFFYFSYQYIIVLFSRFIFRMGEGGKSFTDDSARIKFYMAGLKQLKGSYFIGTGAGSAENSMESMINRATMPHNMFIEVLMQYGLIVFVLFFLFLYLIFRRTWKLNDNRSFILKSMFLAFIPLSIINSNYLLMPAIWILFGSLFAIGNFEVLKK